MPNRSTRSASPLAALLAASVLPLAAACDATVTGAPDSAATVVIDVQPRDAQVVPGGTVSFLGTVTGSADTAVVWEVVEASGGSVSASGTYVAPSATGLYHVRASARADRTVQAVAAVTVTATPGTRCDTTPPRTTGTVYYYCDCQAGADPACVAGSDGNAGTSPASPRRTIGDAVSRFGGMAAGSTIALCRGGVWTSGFGYLPNKTCGTTESTWCDIRDYVPAWAGPATPKPMVNLGSGGFGLAFVNGTTGVRLWNLYFKSTTANHDAGDGMVCVWDSASGLDLCNVTVDGGKVGLNIQSSGTAPSALRQSTITEIGQTGIYHAASNWTFDANLFLNNQQALAGGACGGYCGSYYNHDHYISGRASNVVVKNSEYVTTADHCTNPGRCAGVVVYWTDFQTSPIFENNHVRGPGQASRYGFSSSNNAANTSNYNGIIRRNRFDLPNAATQVELSACTDCQFLDNIVVVRASGGHGLGVPEQTGQSTPPTSGTIVRNNTFYLAGSGQTGVHQRPEGSGYVFENNAVWSSGVGECFHVTQPTAAGHPFNLTTAGNYCRNGSGDALSAVFVDAPNGNFRPVATGPLVGTANQTWYSPVAIGTDLWSPADTGRVRSGPVDIGALQH